MKNSKTNIFVLLVCFGMVLSCANVKTNKYSTKYNKLSCKNLIQGKLVNFTGLDGCGWMIELTNGMKLDPININNFNIPMLEGKSVQFYYTEIKNRVGICMAGKIVEITCMKETLKK
ncbi:hypothetical protein BZARG_03650 [Bizionia argentinensis JUB59]|uniref:Lipoprotein n=1 Tax=Bizionia argentinensis JUB59 TaxID=1046627 RepID=A0A4U8UGF3_9FLAO|nr:hypothetical protein [Bizionia argentinensis]TLG98997.1 hypothetical protein BZARG_03650 [Bizionia argentinensis JUB59]